MRPLRYIVPSQTFSAWLSNAPNATTLTRHSSRRSSFPPRRPGLIQFLPARAKSAGSTSLEGEQAVQKSLDPEPVQKWAEEGYAVIGVEDAGTSDAGWGISAALAEGLKALRTLPELDIHDKFGVIVYDPELIDAVHDAVVQHPEIVAVVAFSDTVTTTNPPRPTLYHLPGKIAPGGTGAVEAAGHEHARSPYFVFPQGGGYEPSAATAAHSKSLVFLRKHVGGPHFDIEAIWEEHTYFEFEVRSVAKTMGTMVSRT